MKDAGYTQSDVSRLRVSGDRDDGIYRYEGDIIYNQMEYEFEVDANTGNFLEWSEDRR